MTMAFPIYVPSRIHITICKYVSICLVDRTISLAIYPEQLVEDQTLPLDIMLNQRQAISKSVHAAELSDYQNRFFYLHVLDSNEAEMCINDLPNDCEMYHITGQTMFRYSGRHRIMGSSHRSGPRDDGFTKRKSQSGHYHRNCQLYGSEEITSNDLSWRSWLEKKRWETGRCF